MVPLLVFSRSGDNATVDCTMLVMTSQLIIQCWWWRHNWLYNADDDATIDCTMLVMTPQLSVQCWWWRLKSLQIDFTHGDILIFPPVLQRFPLLKDMWRLICNNYKCVGYRRMHFLILWKIAVLWFLVGVGFANFTTSRASPSVLLWVILSETF